MLENPATVINMNCVDPLGRWAVIGQNITILTSDWLSRTALLMAIDNENMEMLELLLENKVTRLGALLIQSFSGDPLSSVPFNFNFYFEVDGHSF